MKRLVSLLTLVPLVTSACRAQSDDPETAGAVRPDVTAAFARFDTTEDGWLSRTELDACDCRHYEADGDGEVIGGGLDGVYALLRESDGRPAIVLPRKENQAAGRELDVSGVESYLRW